MPIGGVGGSGTAYGGAANSARQTPPQQRQPQTPQRPPQPPAPGNQNVLGGSSPRPPANQQANALDNRTYNSSGGWTQQISFADAMKQADPARRKELAAYAKNEINRQTGGGGTYKPLPPPGGGQNLTPQQQQNQQRIFKTLGVDPNDRGLRRQAGDSRRLGPGFLQRDGSRRY
jgi:hypothetical protein